MIIRPAQSNDIDALMRLAESAGSGITTLAPDSDRITRRLIHTAEAFSNIAPREARYLFVLEDDDGTIGGCCGIDAAVGLREAFYSYKVNTLVHASRELGVHNRIETLHLSNDYTGDTELCSLILHPNYRAGGLGHLLSRSRLLFMADFQQRFGQRVFAELRGMVDENGRSPFWDGLGQHFFGLDFDRADKLSGGDNRAFIAELMPAHPVYTCFLPEAAKKAIGHTHHDTIAARRMLEREGFRYQNTVDIFDAGPAVEAPIEEIMTIKLSRELPVVAGNAEHSTQWLVSNQRLSDYRCGMVSIMLERDHIEMSEADMQRLRVSNGDSIRIAPGKLANY